MSTLLGIILLSFVCFSEQFSLFPSIFSNKKSVLQEPSETSVNLTDADDTKLTTPELITKYGYNAEVHYATTEDGYVLELHRIAGGPKSPPRKGKKVCYLQHGLVFSSASFVLSGPNHAISYRLADEGYDVWMGNSRGSIYSMNHTIHKSHASFTRPFGSHGFWNFSLDEIGYYDVPASIDYVLNETGETKVHYIGHSQGTTAFFMMTSERPEYQSKIQTAHAMAPAVFLNHMISPLMRLVSKVISPLYFAKRVLPIHYVYPLKFQQKMCRDMKTTRNVCLKLLTYLAGKSDQIIDELVPVFFGHLPTGAASNQFIHYAQWTTSGHFRKFNFGKAGNLLHYNSATPPDYNLKNVTVPISIYYGQNDVITVPEDVKNLIKILPNVIDDRLIKEFNHVDFIWGKQAPHLVYDKIVKTIKLREID